MSKLEDKTLFITGGSRGIGRAIARRAAQDGANVAIAAKTAEPHPKLPGTIYTAAEEIEGAGGTALPLVTVGLVYAVSSSLIGLAARLLAFVVGTRAARTAEGALRDELDALAAACVTGSAAAPTDESSGRRSAA